MVEPAPPQPSGPPAVTLDIIITGRNDGYGGDDFHERFVSAAAFNHARLDEAGVAHRFVLVEWNPPEGRPPLADLIRARLPWWHEAIVASPAWHAWLSENPRLQFMEFFAKNAGIRRSQADWILTTNSDVFLSRAVVERLARGQLAPGTLYRASRLDMDRHMPWREMSWARLEDRRYLLRRLDPAPPYYNEAAGDFLLLDRDAWERVGGFNERIRFSKIHKDGQFCLQAHHHGLAIESLGDVYHLDHDGSFVTSQHQYGPGYHDAPFGPQWDCSKPYRNREDWGLRQAVEVREDAGTLRLLTPEEAGPVLTILVDGAARGAACRDSLRALIPAPGAFEIVVVDPEPGLDAILPAGGRVRIVRTGVTPRAAALAIGQACARGRHLLCLPGPAEVAGLDRLLEALRNATPEQVFACALEPTGERVGIFGRRALDRADGIDPLSGMPIDDLLQRVERTSAATWLEDVHLTAIAWTGAPAGLDPSIECGWTRLASGAAATVADPVPALLVADFQRRTDLLLEHMRARLSRELPADVGSVAVWGLGSLTALAVVALRALDRVVSGVFTPNAEGSATCAGVPVRHPRDLDPSSWIVAVPSSPVEAVALRRAVPASRVIALAEPDVHHPVSPPLGAAPAGLAHARALRERGLLDEAEAACRAWLRDPALADPAPVRYELAIVQQQRGRLREAEAEFRWLLRHWPEHRGTVRYNLASLLKGRGSLDRAAQLFDRVLTEDAPDAQRSAGCHFHLGEIQLTRGDMTGARMHFAHTLQLVPAHGRAREHLARLETSSVLIQDELV